MKFNINKYIKQLLLFFLLLIAPSAFSQIKGVVTDSITNEPLMYISVFYEGKGVGGITNINGEYEIVTRKGWNEITFSAIGYISKVIKITPGQKTLNVQLAPDDIMLTEVVVKPKRERYSRKDNPAVEFMRKVIKNKKKLKLEENDYYSYEKYQKMKTSLSDISDEKLGKGIYKRFSFLKDQVEPSAITESNILPLSIQETVSTTIYRKEPKSQ
ncbi:MAG: carboxypeptidase-like regulatory domain-containing protein, partial [Bacteroides sp.]|nr:carboxypeptidase-like regulatory domain-containing protein [Bacteroides sp.]